MQGIKSLSVYARIGLLGGLIAFTLIALAGTLWYSDSSTSAAVERQQNFAAIERLALETQVSALQMRRREKDFLLRNDPAYLDRYQTEADSVASHLEELAALDAPRDIHQAVEHLQESLPRHREAFATVVAQQTRLGLTHEDGLQGELRSAVRNVEDRLEGFNDDALTVLMLMMRRHEKDFILREEPRYIERFDTRIEEFNALLATRDYPAGDVAEIRALMQAYSRDFHAWAQNQLLLNEEIGTMSEIFGEMEPDFDIILDRARAEGRDAIQALAVERERVRIIAIAMVAAIALLAGALCWWVGRSIAKPVSELTDVMGELANGETDLDVPAQDEGGEIGRMASAVVIFKRNKEEMDRLTAEQAETEARNAEEKRRLMHQMADEFDAQVGTIAKDVATAAENMSAVAAQLRSTAEQSGERSAIVASAAEETSANTQAVASAAEELTSSIREINRQVTDSQELTRNAVQEAEVTRVTVTGLGEAVVKIGDVVTLIQSIAEQTNLLALNATIEASRAGDAGKGFAVVASEVKALADQTAKATLEIADQIDSIQKSGDQAVTAITSVTGMIDRVSEGATAIVAAVEQQDAAANEIANSVSQAADGTAQVTESISALTDNVRETDTGAVQVLDAARSVTSDAERLKSALSGFLDKIRAA